MTTGSLAAQFEWRGFVVLLGLVDLALFDSDSNSGSNSLDFEDFPSSNFVDSAKLVVSVVLVATKVESVSVLPKNQNQN